ncbi:hypothetical protein [Nostoc sp. LEGE 06077]|nr:hypothetical protein [Nostoc sp. LEGE 06077]
MAYSDFILEKAATDLGITTQEADLFPQLVCDRLSDKFNYY